MHLFGEFVLYLSLSLSVFPQTVRSETKAKSQRGSKERERGVS